MVGAAWLAVLSCAVAAAAGSAPGGDERRQWWRDPCALHAKSPLKGKRWQLVLERRVKKVKQQVDITLNHFRLQKLNSLYPEGVREIVKQHFEQTWLPGIGNVNMMRDRISQHFKFLFPELHADLQKFAVALQGMLEDRGEEAARAEALRGTALQLQLLLCEVELALGRMKVAVPGRQDPAVMSPEERHPAGNTARVVRDWGTLSRYRGYLQGWARLLARTTRRRRRASRPSSPATAPAPSR
ncbi:uncharacterized protein LOC134530418 isoform X2 [Bacillus rossius redtenbacheri]|uniref:uncharacterized protein LOC134530418 isoform X2 n=1 Tax=Bacillus rossius redtenbacheri TaxID=93214 RepID=UPI002FDE0873